MFKEEPGCKKKNKKIHPDRRGSVLLIIHCSLRVYTNGLLFHYFVRHARVGTVHIRKFHFIMRCTLCTRACMDNFFSHRMWDACGRACAYSNGTPGCAKALTTGVWSVRMFCRTISHHNVFGCLASKHTRVQRGNVDDGSWEHAELHAWIRTEIIYYVCVCGARTRFVWRMRVYAAFHTVRN